jgi:hypothetical protein
MSFLTLRAYLLPLFLEIQMIFLINQRFLVNFLMKAITSN